MSRDMTSTETSPQTEADVHGSQPVIVLAIKLDNRSRERSKSKAMMFNFQSDSKS